MNLDDEKQRLAQLRLDADAARQQWFRLDGQADELAGTIASELAQSTMGLSVGDFVQVTEWNRAPYRMKITGFESDGTHVGVIEGINVKKNGMTGERAMRVFYSSWDKTYQPKIIKISGTAEGE